MGLATLLIIMIQMLHGVLYWVSRWSAVGRIGIASAFIHRISCKDVLSISRHRLEVSRNWCGRVTPLGSDVEFNPIIGRTSLKIQCGSGGQMERRWVHSMWTVCRLLRRDQQSYLSLLGLGSYVFMVFWGDNLPFLRWSVRSKGMAG